MQKITLEVDASLWMEDNGSICSSLYVDGMDDSIANEATTLTALLDDLIEVHCIPSNPPKIRQADRARLLGLCASLKKEIEQAEEQIRDLKKWKK